MNELFLELKIRFLLGIRLSRKRTKAVIYVAFILLKHKNKIGE